jgi:TolA-binding protein
MTPATSPPVPAGAVAAPAPPLPAPELSAPPAPTPEALYQAAESAMRRRDWAAAARRLEQVVAAGVRSPLEDVARYELAQLALRSGDRTAAARRLDELLASDREPALREPAHFLRCEIRAQNGDAAGARRCLRDFRAAFPGSSRDVTALGWLVRLSPADGGCADQTLVNEYLRRYPAGPDAADAQRRRARCQR